jgi:hypothetical protein
MFSRALSSIPLHREGSSANFSHNLRGFLEPSYFNYTDRVPEPTLQIIWEVLLSPLKHSTTHIGFQSPFLRQLERFLEPSQAYHYTERVPEPSSHTT